MLTKSLLTVFFTSILFISCSKNHDISGETTIPNTDSIPTEKPTSVSFKLTTSSDTITAFSRLQFQNKIQYSGKIDSITISLTNADTSLILILSKNNSGFYARASWEDYYYYQGTYVISTTAYYEGNKISTDSSLKITVLKDTISDFLGMKWSDSDDAYYNGKLNNLLKYYFVTKKSGNSIDVISRSSAKLGLDNSQQYDLLYNLMIKNYSKPNYSNEIDQTELVKHYSTLFSKHNDTPKAIWILKNTKVVLATYEDGYHLYAEKL